MAQSFATDCKAWTQKAQRNAGLVLKGSVQDVGELMTRRAVGTTHGGTIRPGFVPVVTGELINSQEVSINGRVIGRGSVSYSAMVAGLDLGDVFEAVFTAPHARPKEYGHGGTKGWFFVRGAVQNWPAIVAQNAAQF